MAENTFDVASIEVKKTYCRFCEVACGLEAEVGEDGRVLRVRPDKDHPVTRGFACNKGLLATELHHDPDRVNRPQRRTEHGFVDAEWDEAIADVGSRLAAIIDEHGPESVAIYMGNPGAFNALLGLAGQAFIASVGGARFFSAGTQDCSNKFTVSTMLYGATDIHPVADLQAASFILLIGTNPRVSKMSFCATTDPVGTLRGARDRGAEIVFVNPLDLEDLADVGPTLQIIPDTDVYLLAALLHEIDTNPGLGFDGEATAGVVGLDRLRAFVARYSPDRVAEVVGLSAACIRDLARRFAQADGAAVHMSTGVNMGRQGTVAYWLVQMLSLVTGNLDRRGGNRVMARATGGFIEAPPSTEPLSTPWGDYVSVTGCIPGGLLGEMIDAPENPIRALVTVAGNPALSLPGGDRLAQQLDSLELLVTLDFYRSATGEYADWVLPSTDFLEREDVNFFTQGMQVEPYIQWTDAVAQPQHERRHDWWIFDQIIRAMGRPSFIPSPEADVMADVWGAAILDPASGCTVEKLRQEKGGVMILPDLEPGGFLERHSGPEGFECCPAALGPSLARAEEIMIELERDSASRLLLITRRTNYMMNSALQNLKGLKSAAGSRGNPLYMNAKDAAERGLREAQPVIVKNANGEVRTTLSLDDRLRVGVVAMSHGFGNAKATGMSVASQYPGANVNALSPTGAGAFEPVSAMAHITGIEVEVESA